LFHSIVWTYLPEATRARIRTHVAAVGAASATDAPFAWLRFELAPVADAKIDVRLTLWPDGREWVLGEAHPHGASIRWNGTAG
jgi:hypothetical protein